MVNVNPNIVIPAKIGYKAKELIQLLAKRLDADQILGLLIDEQSRQLAEDECDEKYAKNVNRILLEARKQLKLYIMENHS